MKAILLFLCVLFTSPSWAAPALQEAAGDSQDAGVDTASFSYTAGAGSNRVMVACVRHMSQDVTHNAPTYNSVALTQISTTQTFTDGSSSRLSMWYLINPASGTHTFQANFSGNVDATDIIVATFTGVHQTTAIGTPDALAETNTSTTHDVTSAAGELVVNCFGHRGDSVTTSNGAGQTTAADSLADPSFRLVRMTYKDGAATTTMSHTWDGTNEYVAMIGVGLKPAAAGSTRRPLAAIIFQ